jgi:hypothetical protein
MRKIINSAFMSLDGVTADSASWAIFDPDSHSSRMKQTTLRTERTDERTA